jgi:hypothetical protein
MAVWHGQAEPDFEWDQPVPKARLSSKLHGTAIWESPPPRRVAASPEENAERSA